MTDSTVQPPAPADQPSWSQAMQGKTSNAKRIAASKRVVLVMSLVFFGCFLWLYIIYNLSHSSTKKSSEQATPIAGALPPGGHGNAPAAAQLMNAQMPIVPAGASRFGAPRQLDATAFAAPAALPAGASPFGILTPTQQPLAGAPVATAMMASPAAIPGATGTAPASAGMMPSSVGMPAASNSMLPPPPSGMGPGMMPSAVPTTYISRKNSTNAISAPREYRHAIGIAGEPMGAGARKQRLFVER